MMTMIKSIDDNAFVVLVDVVFDDEDDDDEDVTDDVAPLPCFSMNFVKRIVMRCVGVSVADQIYQW